VEFRSGFSEVEMKRISTFSLVSAGLFLSLQLLLAQFPGGGPPGQGPTTPSTFPGTSPNPRDNGPLGTGIPETSPRSKVDDRKFAKDATVAGMTNVEMGRLALEKASSDDIRQFGKKLLDEQTQANDRLKELASQDNISVPDALDTKHQSQIDKLSKLSGAEFDKAYLKEQLKNHEVQVRDFSEEAQRGTDPSVKSFAAGMLPKLQRQLELARNLNKSIKKTRAE
jgi:putative membrane protein